MIFTNMSLKKPYSMATKELLLSRVNERKAVVQPYLIRMLVKERWNGRLQSMFISRGFVEDETMKIVRP